MPHIVPQTSDVRWLVEASDADSAAKASLWQLSAPSVCRQWYAERVKVCHSHMSGAEFFIYDNLRLLAFQCSAQLM